MLRKSLLLRLFVATITLQLSLAASIRAEDRVPAEKLLPAETSFFLTIPDVPNFVEKFKQTSTGRLLKEDSLQELREDLASQWKRLSEETQKEIGIALDDLLKIPSGQLSVGIFQSTQTPQPGFVAILEFGKHRDTVDSLLEKAAEELDAQNAERSIEEIDDTRIVIYTIKNENQNQRAVNNLTYDKLAYFIRDEHFVSSSDVSLLEAVLARWDGRHENTLSNNEKFRYISDRCHGKSSNPVFSWYIDPITLTKTAIQSAANTDFRMQMAMAYLPKLGIENLKAFGGSIELMQGPYDSISRAIAYIDTPTTGLLNLFTASETELKPPTWVAENVSNYYATNWDVKKAYQAVGSLVDSIQQLPGSFDALIDQLAEREDGPGLHLKKDLIDHLTGKIHIVQDSPKRASPVSQRVLIALELNQPDKMKAVLEKIARVPSLPLPIASRKFRGETLYELALPGGLGGEDSPTMGWGVARGHLMYASDITLLEQVHRSGSNSSSLASSEKYKRIAGHFPSKTSTISYKHLDTSLKTIYELLRSGQTNAPTDEIDFSKLPPFESISKYLLPTGGYAVPDPHGAMFVEFTLSPERK